MHNKIIHIAVVLAFLGNIPFSASAQTYPDSDVPLILPRAVWENSLALAELLDWVPEDKDASSFKDENPNSSEHIPDYSPVDRIVIHDTGCPIASPRCNSDTVNPTQVIQSIYHNHARIRGWGDIGYHYIIDRKGNVYQGRFGGNGVRGSHVYDDKNCRNFNVGTIGIVLLGNYTNTHVPQAASDSLSRLTGWLSAVNKIEPANLSRTTPIWANPVRSALSNGTNPKVGNKCDTAYGSFSASFTGPVVLGHNAIELKNTDPGTLDMTQLRTRAKVWADIFSRYLYQERNDARLFSIEGGVIKNVAEHSGYTVVRINDNQLRLFPEENQTTLPDGTLIQGRTRNDIYLLEDGKRRHISSAGIFRKLGYSLAKVRIISDRELLGYAKGDPIIYPDGSLLASERDGKIYMITNGGKKRFIVSRAVFIRNKFKDKEVMKIPETDLEAYPSDGVVGLADGTLVSSSHKATAPNYIIMDGGKKLIPSWDMFTQWKFNKKKISVLPEKDLNLYADRGELLLPDGVLARNAGAPEIYVTRKGELHWITNYDTLAKLKLNPSKALFLSAADFAKYSRGADIDTVQNWKDMKAHKLAQVEKVLPKIIFASPTAVQTPVIPTASASTQPLAQEIKEAEPTMRIGIFSASKIQSINIAANSDFTLIPERGMAKSYSAGQEVSIDWETSGNTKFIAGDQNALFTITSYHQYNWNKSIDFNQFKGNLELIYSPVSQKVWMVNVVPFEMYLAGIGEALNSDNAEYQKAFAIISRSYALFHLRNGGKYGKDEIFYLNNTSSDQIYKGYAWEARMGRLAQAVRDTAGNIIQYNGSVARALYSSDSGGVTKNACRTLSKEFCSANYAYLAGGVLDPEGTTRRDASIITASHGVGMSATGARRLAQLGKTYQEILQYYYEGVTIEKVY